jgi:mono/diheme cytochrome c family protein
VHIAYVMVTDGHGGYTERRIPIITDGIGNPLVAPTPIVLDAPAAAPPSGNTYHTHISSQVLTGTGTFAAMTDIPVALRDLNTGRMYPPQTCATPPCTVKTNLHGDFSIPNVAPGSLQVLCAFDRGTTLSACDLLDVKSAEAYRLASGQYGYGFSSPSTGPTDIVGSALGADGSPCGGVSRYFGPAVGNSSLGEASASASLFDSASVQIQGPVRLDQWGNYEFAYSSRAAKVTITCEAATPVSIAVPAAVAAGGGFVGSVTLTGVAQPVIAKGAITASLSGGTVVAPGPAIAPGPFLPAGSGTLPSDQKPWATRFFAYMGLDSKLGACQYYRAIGGVQSCNASGTMVGAISFDDWKRSEKMAPYLVTGATEHTAAYVNRVDLNLTRRHHLVSYATNQTAGYVCNHLGPKVAKVGLDALQDEVDKAVANSLAGNNLVACVAMDYRVHPGVNGNQPFTRFFIFGPDGSLLPSINLDFEDEKFVPGVCIACHGGDHYAGAFPEDGTGQADVGAHFLPYDLANFSFSSNPALTELAQSAELYRMNQIIAASTGATAMAQELIAGWYASGTPEMDKGWVPAGWKDNSNNIAFYQNVYARHCRTCHVNMPDAFPTAQSSRHFASTVCGGYFAIWRNHTMPNSMVTFNRFWLAGGPGIDQITPTERWQVDGSQLTNAANCYLTNAP